MEKKFNFVYITTNLVTGKQYIGEHSSQILNDSYLGGGSSAFKPAVKKYGKENFKREILEFFDTKEEAFNAQEKYIIEYNTLSPNGYNISPRGGLKFRGSCAESTKELLRKRIISKETREKISKAVKGKNVGKKRSTETKELIRNINIGKRKLSYEEEVEIRSISNMTTSELGKKYNVNRHTITNIKHNKYRKS